MSYYNPHIVTIIELILGGEKALTTKKSKKLDDFFKLGGSNLYLVKIPDTYVNESFGEFFYFLIHHHHSIGIALYRKNIIEGYYYVYTNPKKTTLLRDCDFVFVLANSSNILDLIDERPVIEGLNEGNFNSIRSSSEVESLIEDEEQEGNIKNKTELPQRQDKRKPTTKQSSRKSTRKESKLLTNTEGFVNKLEKKKKQMEDFVKDPENNYLITTFAARLDAIDGLGSAEKENDVKCDDNPKKQKHCNIFFHGIS